MRKKSNASARYKTKTNGENNDEELILNVNIKFVWVFINALKGFQIFQNKNNLGQFRRHRFQSKEIHQRAVIDIYSDKSFWRQIFRRHILEAAYRLVKLFRSYHIRVSILEMN